MSNPPHRPPPLADRLVAHPAHPPRRVAGVECSLARTGDVLDLRYRIAAPAAALRLPPPAAPDRTDGLWQASCLELFAAAADGTPGYAEFNFAPSGQWAAYRFTAPRTGMAPLALPHAPAIALAGEGGAVILSVRLAGLAPGALRLGITAVIEEVDGTKSYWALRHGGDRPDFHDPDCFVRQLPPAD